MFKLSAMAVMVMVNSVILIVARRSTIGRRNNKAVITVSVVCWVFILAYVPTGISCTLSIAEVDLPVWFAPFTNYMIGKHSLKS